MARFQLLQVAAIKHQRQIVRNGRNQLRHCPADFAGPDGRKQATLLEPLGNNVSSLNKSVLVLRVVDH